MNYYSRHTSMGTMMMSHGFLLGTVSYVQSQMISDGVLRCGTPLCCPEGWRHQGRSKYHPMGFQPLHPKDLAR